LEPASPLGRGDGVTIMGLDPTARENTLLAEELSEEPKAVIVKVYAAALAGLPVKMPCLGSNTSPGGGASINQLYGDGPSEALNITAYGAPTAAFGNAAAFVIWGIPMNRSRVAV